MQMNAYMWTAVGIVGFIVACCLIACVRGWCCRRGRDGEG